MTMNRGPGTNHLIPRQYKPILQSVQLHQIGLRHPLLCMLIELLTVVVALIMKYLRGVIISVMKNGETGAQKLSALRLYRY